MTGLLLLADWKDDSYELILVIVDCLIKIIDYKSVKTTIDATGLAKVFIDKMVRYHGFSE